ncbi:MAG: D-alanine--D-alanine ligase [Spirochaetales bacterium]|nr:D-alanine--D-alanine ligase [Spirochaetales bacterium]
MKKLRVGVLFGGKSAEHEVSLRSARSIIEAIDKRRFEVVPIGIDRHGRWYLDEKQALLAGPVDSPPATAEVSLQQRSGSGALVSLQSNVPVGDLDVVFPVLHGPFGEDGTVQGLLKLAGIPFVGSGVLGSAVGMDKDVMKRLLRDAGIPIAPFYTITPESDVESMVRTAITEFGLPLFIKPANLGSSVGISKAHTLAEALAGAREAFDYDTKIIVEKYIPGKEIECSVLGNRNPVASLPGEIKPTDEFYSYKAKYLDENGAELIIPADIEEKHTEAIRAVAVRVFKVLCCAGLARVDMFLTPDGGIVVNEVNTIPGFTDISMYPKLWEASGIGYTELVSRLIDLALERFEEEKRLKTSFQG